MAQNFTDLVNEVHRQGFGLDGKSGTDFFVERPFVTNVNGNYDSKGTGTFDSTRIFRVTGTNVLAAEGADRAGRHPHASRRAGERHRGLPSH